MARRTDEACRCADRRRRLRRPGAGDRAAPGARVRLSPSRSPIRRSARRAADARASAIVAAARRLFETIGVWDAGRDARSRSSTWSSPTAACSDAVRPTFLTFDGDVEPGEPFAHMVENGPLLAALLEKAKDEGVDAASSAVADISPPTQMQQNVRRGHRMSSTAARGWHRNVGAAAGRRRRRALARSASAPALPSARLELRSVRHRHHGGARARS